jgi:hypothetical protein
MSSLILAGVPANLLRLPEVDPQSCSTVQYEYDGKVKKVVRAKQLTTYDAFIESNLTIPCAFGISSTPNDLTAKRMAVTILRRFEGSKILWHTLTGDYKYQRRKLNCQLAVFTNVMYDSTPYKLEVLRDVLELNQHIPKIVVCSGASALELFNVKLHFPINGFLHFNKVK